MMNVWRLLGYFTIIMLAGLQRIPIDLYEAAAIEGANRLQMFIKITIPLMKPVIMFIVTMSTIWLFQQFVQPLVLTSGGPMYSSTTVMLLMYKHGFEWFNIGYAASIAVFIFLIIFILGVIQIKFFREA